MKKKEENKWHSNCGFCQDIIPLHSNICLKCYFLKGKILLREKNEKDENV